MNDEKKKSAIVFILVLIFVIIMFCWLNLIVFFLNPHHALISLTWDWIQFLTMSHLNGGLIHRWNCASRRYFVKLVFIFQDYRIQLWPDPWHDEKRPSIIFIFIFIGNIHWLRIESLFNLFQRTLGWLENLTWFLQQFINLKLFLLKLIF